jgi:flagellar protein FlgJ
MVSPVQSTTINDYLNQFKPALLQTLLKTKLLEHHFSNISNPVKNEMSFQEMLDNLDIEVRSSGQNDQLDELHVETVTTPTTKSTVSPLVNFVQFLWPKAKQAASMIGVDPKILIAQIALETGWGKFITRDPDGSTSNNLFNIKSGTDKESNSITVKTSEYDNNEKILVSGSFRTYPSVEHSFNDYVSLITKSDRYQSALSQAQSPENFVRELQKAGYATDPNYGSKILAIYYSEELNKALNLSET